MILLIVIYVFFAFLVAYSGKNVVIGFWGVFIMSLLLTPLITAILIVLLRSKARKIEFEEDWEDL